ncbi:MAG: glycosyltransferase family 2 protein [Chitinispirillaceae bacterium]|nr:glycosyltransferase family 2 protein [Chitinispirillaceae bacterium]
MNNLSVTIITKNEEKNIEQCLESVKWADEIIIVDAQSTDNTISIAKKFTEKIYIKEWEGYGKTRNFAISQCKNDWVFVLDADERISCELREEIIERLSNLTSEIRGFSIPRRTRFLGKWINHCGWYPERSVRLFRKGYGYFTLDKVHEKFKIEGKIEPLTGEILHYPFSSLSHYISKLNLYTNLASEEMTLRNKKFSKVKLLLNPFWTFIRMYFVNLGFLDGIAGFILCVLSSGYVFIKYAKLYELSLKKE